jgi:uncharacterized protein YndB with AHSA1/START domain
MPSQTVSAEALIPAPPDKVYGILADYRGPHQSILPKPEFVSVEAEQGGVGAGTRLKIRMKAMGTDRVFHEEVLEPEPGRVLVERDLEAGTATTFTVSPAGAGQAHVRIETEWRARSGLAGWLENALTRRFLAGLYRRELKQLADVAGRQAQ